MIGTVGKPIEEIMPYLDGKDNLFVVGCGGCAKAIHSGGDGEMARMVEELIQRGKMVIASGVPERTCYIQHTRMWRPRGNGLRRGGANCQAGHGGVRSGSGNSFLDKLNRPSFRATIG